MRSWDDERERFTPLVVDILFAFAFSAVGMGVGAALIAGAWPEPQQETVTLELIQPLHVRYDTTGFPRAFRDTIRIDLRRSP